VRFLAPLGEFIDSLVHPSVRGDALAAARQHAFIALRLLGGLIALGAFPVHWALRGAPSTLEAIVFAWLLAPILIAYYLSRTGQYDRAHILSSFALTGLVVIVAASTGGISSFVAVWLVVVPFEAALSASRRVIAAAATFALAGGALLLLLPAAGLTPAAMVEAGAMRSLAAIGIGSAVLYATGLALATQSLARTGSRLLSVEEARYRLLARNMTDVIVRHGRNGAVLFASPAAEALFGMPVHELRGHRLFDRVHVGDRPAYLTAIAEAAVGGHAQSVEFRVRRDAAETGGRAPRFIWIEMRCRPLDRTAQQSAGEEGADREVVSVMRDVTERKAQHQVLEDARAEAERANAAKGGFLATVSHELRTPLNVIIGFSDMLVHEQSLRIDQQRRLDYARMINDSGHHLLSVVNGILDMSKIENGHFVITPEPFAPGPVIVNCCDLLALKARDAGIDLVHRLAADLPEIVADKRAVKQILLNLLSNAIKFTGRGGTVSIDARIEGRHLLLSITDTGVGIAEADLPRLGDPFFQARGSYDRPHDGTGLGLSIVKGLLTLHRGRMEFRSRVGEGTCVTISLPLTAEAAPEGAARIEALGAARAPATGAEVKVRKRA
jgi:two-component system, cell cycle sensor histidine kinase DivJ